MTRKQHLADRHKRLTERYYQLAEKCGYRSVEALRIDSILRRIFTEYVKL